MTYRFNPGLRILLFACLSAMPLRGYAVETYDACTALVAADPARAVREAGTWSRYGGGAPARHCYAMALNESGAPGRAAAELVAIANEEPALEDRARAEIVVQAGDILLELGDVLSAGRLAQQALRLSPGLTVALRLSARGKMQTGALEGALRDLDRALEKTGARADLLALRASVNRQLGRLIAARDDAVYATEAMPEAPAGWLERGRVAIRMDDRDAARDALLRAISLDRDGATAQAAREALQRMETGALN